MELQRLRDRSTGTFGQLLCGCILRKEVNAARPVEQCGRHRDTRQGARFDLESWVRPCGDPFVAVTVRVETPTLPEAVTNLSEPARMEMPSGSPDQLRTQT